MIVTVRGTGTVTVTRNNLKDGGPLLRRQPARPRPYTAIIPASGLPLPHTPDAAGPGPGGRRPRAA